MRTDCLSAVRFRALGGRADNISPRKRAVHAAGEPPAQLTLGG